MNVTPKPKLNRKAYKEKLHKDFDKIFSDLRQHILRALVEVEDFLGTRCEVDTPEALTLTPADHDEFYIMTDDGMGVLLHMKDQVS